MSHATKLLLAQVIGLSKLRTNYREYDAKRKLCDSYDLFLADLRILPYLPRLLGKKFFEKKKCVGVFFSRLSDATTIRSFALALISHASFCFALSNARLPLAFEFAPKSDWNATIKSLISSTHLVLAGGATMCADATIFIVVVVLFI